MKTNIKKLAAWMLAMLLVFQIMPVMAEAEVSNVLQSNSQFREKLEISTSNGSYLLINQTEQLSATEGYSVEWASSNEEVVTVDSNGFVTAVGAGEAQITAQEGSQTAKEIITVINPTQSYTVTYEVNYPKDAVIQLYPDSAPSKAESRTFSAKSAPTAGGRSRRDPYRRASTAWRCPADRSRQSATNVWERPADQIPRPPVPTWTPPR